MKELKVIGTALYEELKRIYYLSIKNTIDMKYFRDELFEEGKLIDIKNIKED